MLCIHLTIALPQFFGQTFSSSSFVGPNGQVVSNSIYTDSDGNRVINGSPVQQQSSGSGFQQLRPAPQIQQQQQQQPGKVSSPNKNSGAYVHDDSGKWKGN